MRDWLLLVLLLSLGLAGVRAAAQAELETDVPEYHAEDASAAVVTERNLLASERFWPYQAGLARPWQPPGRAEPLPPGIPGVLIRVEAPGGRARIDFGRDGLYEVPVTETDLVERANRVRLGELDKIAPNFVVDLGPRLLDPAGASPRPFGLRATAEHSGFLCVFADPSAPGFEALVAGLAPLRDRHGVLSILFPQGRHADERIGERLRALGWPTPFVLDHLSEPYTRSLLEERTSLPAVLLVTNEGRVLFQSPWKPGVEPELAAVLSQAFGAAPRAEAARGR